MVAVLFSSLQFLSFLMSLGFSSPYTRYTTSRLTAARLTRQGTPRQEAPPYHLRGLRLQPPRWSIRGRSRACPGPLRSSLSDALVPTGVGPELVTSPRSDPWGPRDLTLGGLSPRSLKDQTEAPTGGTRATVARA